jgi:hypothetical protein
VKGQGQLETHAHILKVQEHLLGLAKRLVDRAAVHDASKLESPEVEAYDRLAGSLKGLTYGSPEYKAALAELGPALEHHYAANDHHPEHFEHGVADMDLVQVLEMLADWKAATERHADGDLRRSIEQNAERFVYGPEFKRLLLNTARNMGWLGCPLCEAGHAPLEPCGGQA